MLTSQKQFYSAYSISSTQIGLMHQRLFLEKKVILSFTTILVGDSYLMKDVNKLLELKAKYGDRKVEAALFVIDTSLPHPGLKFDITNRTMNVRASENQ